MDKLLDFLVSYLSSIFVDKKGNLNIKLGQTILLGLLFIILLIITILGVNNGGSNEVLKEISVFSFYILVIMVFLGIIGVGGLKDLINRNKKDIYENNKDLIDSFKGMTSKIISLFPDSKFIKNKNILTLKKVSRKYEINVWMDESDIDFGMLYVWLPNDKIRELVLEKSSLLIANENFSDDSLILNMKYDSIIKRIDDLKNQQKEIDNELLSILK